GITIVLGRSQERIAAAFSIDGELPRGERHVLPPIATFPDREADQLETAERASVGFEDHFRVRQFSWRAPFLVRNDLHGHEFACVFGHTSSEDAEALGRRRRLRSHGSMWTHENMANVRAVWRVRVDEALCGITAAPRAGSRSARGRSGVPGII